jgi:hypothetical protein
LKFVLIALLL